MGDKNNVVQDNICTECGDVAGRDINNSQTYHNTQIYLLDRVNPLKHFLNGIQEPYEKDFQKTEFNTLKNILLTTKKLKKPCSVSVRGTLFPSALLSSGWWDRLSSNHKKHHNWKCDLQKWLFHGFDLWGPSWAFSWNLLDKNNALAIAQFGEGDEANTIPVIISCNKAMKLLTILQESWGGREVEISGVLGHKKHFAHKNIPIELIGGLLDYCIYLEDDNCNHKIEILCCKTDIYSGYLWKCLVPKKWINDRANVQLDNVYFIWEHTDFTKSDALKYNLDSLYQKEKYIENLHGELILLQKSSNHIQGTPIWEDRKFYDLLRGKTNEII